MYVVTKKFGRAETQLKNFTKENEAVKFIFDCLKEDRNFKVMATYGLYEGADLVKEYTQSDIPEDADLNAENSDQAQESSGAQMGSTQTFSPSPFNTTPRLGPQTGLRQQPTDNSNKDDNSDKS